MDFSSGLILRAFLETVLNLFISPKKLLRDNAISLPVCGMSFSPMNVWSWSWL